MCPPLFQPGVHAGAGRADAGDDALLVRPSELLRLVQRINELFERLGLAEQLPRGAAKIELPRSFFEADGGSFAYDSRHVAQNAFIVGNLVAEDLLPVTTTANRGDNTAAQLHAPTYTDEEYTAASTSTEPRTQARHNWTREQTDALFALARSAIGQQRQSGEQSDPIIRAAGQWLELHPQLSLSESEVRGRFCSFSAKLARARSQRTAAPDPHPHPERRAVDRPPKQPSEPTVFSLSLSSTDASLVATDISISVSAATVRQLCRSVERALGCSDRLALLLRDASGEEKLVCEAFGGIGALPHNAAVSVCRAASYTSSDGCAAQIQTTTTTTTARACEVSHGSRHMNGASPSAACGQVRVDRSGTAEVAVEPATLPVFVELGAGRGGLSFAIGVVGKHAVSHILLDRASPRNKYDKFHPRRLQITLDSAGYAHTAPHMSTIASAPKSETQIGGARSFLARAKMDLRDVWLPALAVLRGADVVGVAKHLCGSATDYALRALLCRASDPARRSGSGSGGAGDGDAGEEAAAGFRVRGVAIATCCHHRCDAGSYINMRWMAALGVSDRDFALMCKLAAWATSDAHAHASAASEHSDCAAAAAADDRDSDGDGRCSEPAASVLATDGSGEPLDVDAAGRSAPREPAASDTASARATEPCARGSDADEAVDFRHVTKGAAFPLDRAQKTRIGLRVKRLLDHGRVLFLREHGGMPGARAVQFCEATTTVENTLLLGTSVSGACSGME